MAHLVDLDICIRIAIAVSSKAWQLMYSGVTRRDGVRCRGGGGVGTWDQSLLYLLNIYTQYIYSIYLHNVSTVSTPSISDEMRSYLDCAVMLPAGHI